MDWTNIIVTLLSLVGAGGIVKLYTQYSKNRKERRAALNATELAFRAELKSQIKLLIAELKAVDVTLAEVHDTQIELIKENANLKAQLSIANKEILELKAQIKSLIQRN